MIHGSTSPALDNRSQWSLVHHDRDGEGRAGWVLLPQSSWEVEVKAVSILWAKVGAEEGSSASCSAGGQGWVSHGARQGSDTR